MINPQKHIELILIVGFSFLFFFRSLDIYFLSDNIGHIERAKLFLTTFQYGSYFRPVWALTLIVDKFLWGVNYSGYHLSNLIFHTSTSILVYILAYQLVQNRFFATITSLLFLIHPIHSLSIFWISGRTDVVCSLFYLSSIIFFIVFNRNNKIQYQTLSVITFIFALFSKEMALIGLETAYFASAGNLETFGSAAIRLELRHRFSPMRFVPRSESVCVPCSPVIVKIFLNRSSAIGLRR